MEQLCTPTNIRIAVGLVALLLVAGIWRHFRTREIRAARAYTYLALLGREGSSEEVANRMALTTDMFAARQLKREIALHVDSAYSGSLPAMISAAKSKGFRG